MKCIRFSLISIAIFLSFIQPSISQIQMNGAVVNIAFYNKTMYYPGNQADNPIYVRVTIANNSSESVRFKLADDRMFSVDFTGYTVRNAQLAHTETFIRKRSTNQTVFFREITLDSGEEFSFIENVKDYLVINEPAVYIIETHFYPDLFKTQLNANANNKDQITSNRLTIEVVPQPSAASVAALPLSTSSAQILKPEPIAPNKVVEQTIIARQKSLWDQYFLYMDVEQLLLKDPARSRRYRTESAEGRARMVENYKLDLRQSRIDKDIVAIPVSFQIEKTVYTSTDGSVTVLEWFQYDTFKEKKRYTYYVRQRDGIWIIYDYTVENLGTE